MTEPKILKYKDPKTNEPEKEYILEADQKEKIIGRHPDCDIQFDDITVSGKHAIIIHHKDGSVYIQDTNSTNNTYILRKGEEIDVQDYIRTYRKRLQLFPGDIIRLGKKEQSSRLEIIVKKGLREELKAKKKLKLSDTQEDS
ncbi:MAG: FHA domain-containing protein [Candidatus Pacearchaeota archaeon]